MTGKQSPMELGRRERQIMAFLYKHGEATAAEVMEGIADPPTYSGVRAMLRILEEKGYLDHRQEGQRYVYRPTESPEEARGSALRYLVQAFFNGSAERAVAALLKNNEFSDSDLDQLSTLLEQAKKEEKQP